jgi:hypothetical protein
MKLIRGLMAALTATVLAAIAIRLGGSGETPPQRGGWRPLDLGSQSGPDH